MLEFMNDTIDFPTVSRCEPEWLERPVCAVATHISLVYHEFTRDQLPLIAGLAARVQSLPNGRWTEFVSSLVSLVSQLSDAVETHTWTEDDLLFPVLVAHEYPGVLSTNVSQDELSRRVDMLSAEHIIIRQIIAEVDELTGGFHAPSGSPIELEDLLKLVEELTLSLIEELDLEDRCLLPRARQLAARG